MSFVEISSFAIFGNGFVCSTLEVDGDLETFTFICFSFFIVHQAAIYFYIVIIKRNELSIEEWWLLTALKVISYVLLLL